eukprot:TRINITY_DN64232_c0_g1_i1.p1 TRINITY_DN64232_c0_g1~~TRINITY_DN64232_c0_g1_i1.p1  ORF type:complete len:357 (+),score=68.06 TRINITY_DN64232_c0_g1_i1:37-1107(+)
MGIRDEDLADPASVSCTLRCGACRGVFDEPIFCAGRPCEHVFCRGCLVVEKRDSQDEEEEDVAEGDSWDDEEEEEEEDEERMEEESEWTLQSSFSSLPSPRRRRAQPRRGDSRSMTSIRRCPVCLLEVAEEDAVRPHKVLCRLVGELPLLCRRRCGWAGPRDERALHAADCPLLALEAVDAQVRSRDCRIAALKAEQEAQRQRLQAQKTDRRILERDEKITELECAVEMRDACLIDLGRQLLMREVRIAALEDQLKEQNLYVSAVMSACETGPATPPPRTPMAPPPTQRTPHSAEVRRSLSLYSPPEATPTIERAGPPRATQRARTTFSVAAPSPATQRAHTTSFEEMISGTNLDM